MKNLTRLFSLLLLSLVAVRAAAPSNDAIIAAVTAADKERVAATAAGDRARLEAILSPDLRYAHSNGAIDTRSKLVDSLVTKRTIYESMDYKERNFVVAGPGVVLMSGHVLVTIRQGEQKRLLDLNFLSAWREEQGKWKFLAWQSSKNPEPAAKK
ncbi:MAG: nuclear transport factor 2 family protein [Verrucomicrobiota bacterium]